VATERLVNRIPAAVVKIAAPAIIPTIIGMVISTRWRRKWNLDAVRPASPDRRKRRRG
jgi:hypothetical protein